MKDPKLRSMFLYLTIFFVVQISLLPAQQNQAGEIISCCGQSGVQEEQSVLEQRKVRLNVIADQRASFVSESSELQDIAKERLAAKKFADELAGNDDKLHTRLMVGSLAQALRAKKSSGATRLERVSPGPTVDPDDLVWNSSTLNSNFRKLIEQSSVEGAGLYPIIGPPSIGRVVGFGTQNVGNQKFLDCVCVGRMVGGQPSYCCTGTLIAPQVVVTAGHCFPCTGNGSNTAVVFVGSDVDDSGHTFTGRAVRHPDYNDNAANDVAVILLDQPVPGVTPRRLATPSEISRMTFGRVMGFGSNNNSGIGGFGVKRMVDVPVASLACDRLGEAQKFGCDSGLELVAGFVGLGTDSCNGDSGGPIYALIDDDARQDENWVLVGATSRATNLATMSCGDGGVYARLDKFRSFLDPFLGATDGGGDNGDDTSDGDDLVEKIVQVRVQRHSTVGLSDSEADRILEDMGTVLRRVDPSANPATPDVSTRIRFIRSGPVQVLPANVPAVIQTQSQLNSLFLAGSGVKIVRRIRFCSGPGGSIIGCAPIGINQVNIAAIPFDDPLESILWVHEYGHNVGLNHRTNDNNAIMFPSIGSNRLVVNQFESNRFLNGPEALSGRVMPSQSHQGIPSEQTYTSQTIEQQSVADFVRQHYYHGISYEDCQQFNREDSKKLINMLAQPKANQKYLSEIVTTLCFIGDDSAVEPIIAFVKSDLNSDSEFNAKNAALIHLGDLICRTKNKAATDFLLQVATEPAATNEMVESRLSLATERARSIGVSAPSADELKTELQVSALMGMGLTGDPDLATVLVGDSVRRVDESITDATMDALKINRKIQRLGQSEYYRQHNH